ncbi:MAG: hypothetical protein RMA76_38275 [Deltaproteobacteria bacterium]
MTTTIAWEATVEWDHRLTGYANLGPKTHWALVKKAKDHDKDATRAAWRDAGRPTPPGPVLLRFTRIAPRAFDDDDNLRDAFKFVKDEICRCIGYPNDAHPNLRFEFAQRRGAVRQYTVRIEMFAEVRRGR